MQVSWSERNGFGETFGRCRNISTERIDPARLGAAYAGAAGPGWGGGTVRVVIRYCFTDAAAAITTPATSRGCDTLAAWDASSSVTWAPARFAM